MKISNFSGGGAPPKTDIGSPAVEMSGLMAFPAQQFVDAGFACVRRNEKWGPGVWAGSLGSFWIWGPTPFYSICHLKQFQVDCRRVCFP